jgi:hypothetical protein
MCIKSKKRIFEPPALVEETELTMNKKLRNAVIAGNWKMNKTPSEAKKLVEEIKPLVKDAKCGVIVCVPYVDLTTVLEAAKGSNIKVGAENCHWEKAAHSQVKFQQTCSKKWALNM